MVTKSALKIIESMKNADSKIASENVGKSRNAMYTSNTRVYKEFRMILDLMVDNYPTFERRMTHDPELYTQLRRLARMIRKEQ
jgi:hypothetical protein